ncbi:putative non-specific lipid-transfer protein [Penaeus vannamei]|uniref:Putative non-specific lipid-transfer protein n=1 Tax=Penaeus vannamei TaxID=6689 RepID=A0A3R7P855_PENVA|nr:putative non-specific lipid-transfer protein [Penaeus vannamei]
MEMATDLPSTFEEESPMKIVGFDMTRTAAQKVFSIAGESPANVDVVELHDCFSANELITYEALGLCGEGEAGKMIDAGDNTYGGKYVINPSGGLISKGHPLGATVVLDYCPLGTGPGMGDVGNKQLLIKQVPPIHITDGLKGRTRVEQSQSQLQTTSGIYA